MARLFPQAYGATTRSAGEQAELATLEDLRAALPDAYTIFHGVHWADEGPRGTAIGELDFAIVNQAGAILLVEQKAGDLQEGANGLAKTYGERRVTVADQVHRALNHIQAKYANAHPGTRPQLDYLVYLPHHRVESVQAAGIDTSRLVHAGSDDTLAARIERILGAGKVDPDRAEASRAFFRQQLNLAPSIDHAVATHERVYTRLAEGLATVADRLSMQPWRLQVSARAGAGKTQLAQRFLAGRERALYVCFNRPLAEQMETLLPATDVHTFHSLCRQILEAAGEPFEAAERGHDSAFWQEVEQRTERLLLDHGPQYRTLVVDEGQDFTPDWYEILRLYVTEDADILWLEDPLQDLHQRPPVELAGFATWHTRENHRSPRHIARYIERHLGIELESRNDLPGDPVELIAYNGEPEQIERAGEQVHRLIERGYSPEQITLLTVHGLERSPFAQVEAVGGQRLRRHTGYTDDGHQQMTAGKLTFDSIHRHKGQQAPAVILADVDYPDWREARARNILYTAMTRAGLHLTILHAADTDTATAGQGQEAET